MCAIIGAAGHREKQELRRKILRSWCTCAPAFKISEKVNCSALINGYCWEREEGLPESVVTLKDMFFREQLNWKPNGRSRHGLIKLWMTIEVEVNLPGAMAMSEHVNFIQRATLIDVRDDRHLLHGGKNRRRSARQFLCA